MANGFLRGVFWGTALSLAAASTASLLSEGPQPPSVGDAAPGAVTAPATGNTAQTTAGQDTAPKPGAEAPQVTAPAPDRLTAVDSTDTAPVPQAGAAEDLPPPGAVTEPGAMVPGTETSVLPNPQAMAPQAPVAEQDLSISTDPAQPPAPSVSEEAAIPTPPAPGDDAPDAIASEQAAPEPQTPAAAPALTAAEPAPEPATEPAPLQDAVTDLEVADSSPRVTALPQADAPQVTDRPRVGKPATTLVERDTPQISESLPNLATVDPTGSAPEGAPPVVAFAQPFDNELEKPLMAIVLMDEGNDLSGGSIGLAALRSFPYPLSFAVDSSLPDAAERMAAYRAQGFEVLAMIDLPEGATATDAEVSLSVALNKMPQVVAVIEGTGAGLQTTRGAADQVTAILAQTGHGFVTRNAGLNTVQKLASRAGVPSAVVFRDFDSKGQTPTVIRRFLDQAAFRAGQDGAVIMLGRVRPDTISALLLWGLQDRAAQVSLAPVSAVLTSEQP